jgi:hypothetical protein
MDGSSTARDCVYRAMYARAGCGMLPSSVSDTTLSSVTSERWFIIRSCVDGAVWINSIRNKRCNARKILINGYRLGPRQVRRSKTKALRKTNLDRRLVSWKIARHAHKRIHIYANSDVLMYDYDDLTASKDVEPFRFTADVGAISKFEYI